MLVSGERLNGIQEVMGSIPTVSTKEAVIIVITASFFAKYLLDHSIENYQY